MMNRRHFASAALALLATPALAAETLAAAFARIEAGCGGRLGVAMLDTATGQRASHREAERFPMGSTYKLFAAAAELARADAGQESLDRRIRYGREDLVTYSPATEKHVGANGMTLAELCDAAITLSDNTAGNLLLGTLGGPQGFTTWLRTLGDPASRLDRLEPTVNEATPGDPRDTTTPGAMLASLRAVTLGNALAPASRTRLTDWLRANRTGNARLRAGLPPGWQAGEKTGTAGHATSNDVGLLWPAPGRPPILVAAFITEGPADGARRDAALAAIGASIAASVA